MLLPRSVRGVRGGASQVTLPDGSFVAKPFRVMEIPKSCMPSDLASFQKFSRHPSGSPPIDAHGWQIFDAECKRMELTNLPLQILQEVSKGLDLDEIRESLGKPPVGDTLAPIEQLSEGIRRVHWIRYEFGGDVGTPDAPYVLERHHDSSDITVSIYLSKDSSVSEQFFIELPRNRREQDHVDELELLEDRWKTSNTDRLKCLVFWGCLYHRGLIFGVGFREVLSFFIDLSDGTQ